MPASTWLSPCLRAPSSHYREPCHPFERATMIDSFSFRVQALAKSVRMLALIGASIKLRSHPAVDPAIRQTIDHGALLALGQVLLPDDDEEISQVLTMVEMALGEASELFRNPDRGANWEIFDPAALQAIGRASRSVFTRICQIAEAHPRLQDALEGCFLDVGTGVAEIALEAARTCPRLRVEGIDIWEPALKIARKNVGESGFADRVTIRKLDVAALDERDRYTLAWLPTMYLKRASVEIALDRIARASRSDAYLVAALYSRAEDPFLALMADLRTLRSGGEIRNPALLRSMMEARGYVDLEMSVTPLATFVFGRLP
ncbi:SAM-dependent methyltransferase [Rhizobium sp. YIM 134829]|uniref:SAM-dependent methyltransferase n=1 Tax=Rhizobium sp. YIM 134829 TaxID=3390453 RepID=UPI00397ABC35